MSYCPKKVVNALKTNRKLFYLKTLVLLHSKHFPSWL